MREVQIKYIRRTRTKKDELAEIYGADAEIIEDEITTTVKNEIPDGMSIEEGIKKTYAETKKAIDRLAQ